jgi:hypothetical protein
MPPVEYRLTTDHRGWARIQVQPPFSLFGDFLSSIISPTRIRDLQRLLTSYRADPTQYAEYAHDYSDLWFDPSDGVVKIVIDRDEQLECEMSMVEFVPMAEQWLAHVAAHPVTFPNKHNRWDTTD